MELYSENFSKIWSINKNFCIFALSNLNDFAMYQRLIEFKYSESDSIFLFGARQTGKTTALTTKFGGAVFYDLLDSNTLTRLQRNPSILREELDSYDGKLPVIIDEIQLLPELLNEVHLLITRKNFRFVLSGSSARKLRRKGYNTLGGRALRYFMYPLVSAEIQNFDFEHAIKYGMLPRHYDADGSLAEMRIESYTLTYLKEEIKAEAIVRNLATFSRFLEIAALTDGEMVNYSNIAQDCWVDSKTVKEYFAILEETLIGYMVPAFSKTVKRKLRQSPKFYYFDVGIVNGLLKRFSLGRGTPEYGHAFEHLLLQEIVAYLGYNGKQNALSYWHTYSDVEVDAVLGDAEVAIEFKSCEEVLARHIKGLKVFVEEHPKCRLIIVSHDLRPRRFNDVEVMPATYFLQQLWSGKIY